MKSKKPKQEVPESIEAKHRKLVKADEDRKKAEAKAAASPKKTRPPNPEAQEAGTTKKTGAVTMTDKQAAEQKTLPEFEQKITLAFLASGLGYDDFFTNTKGNCVVVKPNKDSSAAFATRVEGMAKESGWGVGKKRGHLALFENPADAAQEEENGKGTITRKDIAADVGKPKKVKFYSFNGQVYDEENMVKRAVEMGFTRVGGTLESDAPNAWVFMDKTSKEIGCKAAFLGTREVTISIGKDGKNIETMGELVKP